MSEAGEPLIKTRHYHQAQGVELVLHAFDACSSFHSFTHSYLLVCPFSHLVCSPLLAANTH